MLSVSLCRAPTPVAPPFRPVLHSMYCTLGYPGILNDRNLFFNVLFSCLLLIVIITTYLHSTPYAVLARRMSRRVVAQPIALTAGQASPALFRSAFHHDGMRRCQMHLPCHWVLSVPARRWTLAYRHVRRPHPCGKGVPFVQSKAASRLVTAISTQGAATPASGHPPHSTHHQRLAQHANDTEQPNVAIPNGSIKIRRNRCEGGLGGLSRQNVAYQ